jgi:dipeptidyl-peptidase-4
VYGGPGHRLVTCDRGAWFIEQFIANLGYIVVTSDNRGTPCRGAMWEKALKSSFKELPLRDQVIVIKALAAEDASMDLSRGVGIFGQDAHASACMHARKFVRRPPRTDLF